MLSEAGKVILKIWKFPIKKEELMKKFELEKPFFLHEYCLEAIPSALIAITLANLQNKNDPTLGRILGFNSPMFMFSLCVSVLCASVGLTKSLLAGPTRIMTQDGPLGGVISGRFFFAFLASASLLVTKGFWIFTLYDYDIPLYQSIVSLLTVFLPGFLFGVALLRFKKSSLSLIYQQPSIFLMPIFTLFTFSKVRTEECLDGIKDGSIALSARMTLINIYITVG